MFLTTKTIIMNKVISHIHYIYITSPLSKKKLGCNPFTINLYFNSSQYYPTLGKTLAIQLYLHLRKICQVIPQGFSKEYRLTVDASDVGVGAVLSQEGKDDIYLPNCYVF
jgi:hypothetical protein